MVQNVYNTPKYSKNVGLPEVFFPQGGPLKRRQRVLQRRSFSDAVRSLVESSCSNVVRSLLEREFQYEKSQRKCRQNSLPQSEDLFLSLILEML